MDLTFDRGDYQRPRGHALVYFRVDTEEQLYASYVVALPVKSDFGKYVPPFLAGHLGNAPIDLSKIALPPVPEPVSGSWSKSYAVKSMGCLPGNAAAVCAGITRRMAVSIRPAPANPGSQGNRNPRWVRNPPWPSNLYIPTGRNGRNPQPPAGQSIGYRPRK